MKNLNFQMIERQFQLMGKASQLKLQEDVATLIKSLEQMHLTDDMDTETKKDHAEILALLKAGFFDGNEAGATQYVSFASTEIEESFRRMKNGEEFAYLRYRHHWHKFPHSHMVRDFPVHLGIETSSVCDLRCKMCFQSDPEFRDKKENFGLMDYDLYKQIIDEGMEKGLCSVKLSIRGEPILHPRLPEMISYAREKGILDVMFNTNANQLDEEKSRAILSAQPHLVIFSVDADTKELFESIRIGADFERVVRNITRFHEIREKEFPQSITKTRVQMTVVSEAKHEVSLVQKRWQEMVDQIAIKDALVRQHIVGDAKTYMQQPCRVLWQRLDVHYDGSVWLCDNDYCGKYCVGHFPKESIHDIWHSERMREVRRLHSAGCRSNMEPCGHCDGL